MNSIYLIIAPSCSKFSTTSSSTIAAQAPEMDLSMWSPYESSNVPRIVRSSIVLTIFCPAKKYIVYLDCEGCVRTQEFKSGAYHAHHVALHEDHRHRRMHDD